MLAYSSLHAHLDMEGRSVSFSNHPLVVLLRHSSRREAPQGHQLKQTRTKTKDVHLLTDRQVNRQADRQTNEQTGRQTDE